MKRLFFLFLLILLILSCSDENKSNTTYTIITDHFSGEVEENVLKTLAIEDYSPCPNLATSTYKSRIIRYDLEHRNETNIIGKSIVQSIFPSRLKSGTYMKKLGGFAFPAGMRKDHNEDVDPQNLEFFINSFDVEKTRVFGLHSLGLEYKNLNLNHQVNHFQNIFDLKDALSDYICNEIDTKNAVILMNLFNDTSLEDCLAACEVLPKKEVCADDGNTYRNLECLKCYGNLEAISCDKGIPVFKKELLTERAFEVFYQFAEAQELIANDKNSRIANDLVDNTLRLFDNENRKVEILNLGTEKPIRFTTRQYLKRLMNRPFDKIVIEWNRDWTVVDDWTDAEEEIPQSEMTATGKQVFKGYRKNLTAYSDAIDKNVNFQAKLVETIDSSGNEVLEWKVFIGDITIASDPTSI